MSTRITAALRRSSLAVTGLAALLAGCSNALVGEGETCAVDTDCAAGVCVDFEGRKTCSSPCPVAEPCPESVSGSALVCREDGFCHAPCTFSGARDGLLCRDREVVECASVPAAEACADCGCTAFGGGICVEGTGCVQPGPAGTSCAADAFCESGLCDPSSSTCVAPIAEGEECTEDRFCASGLCNPLTSLCTAPLAAGEACESDHHCASSLCGVLSGVCQDPAAIDGPCSADRECQSSNCSTDGDATRVGVCRQPLGAECIPEQCNRCIAGEPFGFPGYCSRNRCDPDTAPCGSLGGRNFACRESVDGDFLCYETCPTNEEDSWSYNCLQSGDSCHSNTGSCW